MNMKLPLTVVLVIAVFIGSIAVIAVNSFDDKRDSKINEIGTVEFEGAIMKSWKAGDCFIFGVAPTEETRKSANHNMIQSPVFFSNCQR